MVKTTRTLPRLTRSPVAVLDGELRLKLGNGAFYTDFKLSLKHAVDRSIDELDGSPLNLPAVHQFWAGTLSSKKDSSSITVEYEDTQNGERGAVLRARRVDQTDASRKLILLVLTKS